MGQPSAKELKSEARQRALACASRGVPVTTDLAPWLRARGVTRIAGYLPLPSEVDVLPALAALAQVGVEVVLPRIIGANLEFVVTALAHSDFSTSALGTREPVAGTAVPLETCDVVLVPALACDLEGNRLGRGAGFYDRALANLGESTVRIGVVHDTQVWAAGELPTEPHDATVSVIATPTTIVNVNQGDPLM